MRRLVLFLGCCLLCACGEPPRSRFPIESIVGTELPGLFDPPGGVGAKGGRVNLLHFAVTGDTRPDFCDDSESYPTAVIQHIVDRMRARQVQFAVDLGDHMFVCAGNLAEATHQMALYTQATQSLGAPFFMTLGNHECLFERCLPDSTNDNYLAFMGALAPASPLPYYTFDVQTDPGLARFVVVADNAWSHAQARWLEATLAEADQAARYTIVLRHHPVGDSSFTEGRDIVFRHKLSLFLTGHKHRYEHDLRGDPSGRSVVVGVGGAPLDNDRQAFGYGVVTQSHDGSSLMFTMFDEASDAPIDQWAVGSNR